MADPTTQLKKWSEVVQLCPTLWDPMDYSPLCSSVRGNSPGKKTGVGCHFLLQGIFPTQGSNPGLPHCRQTLPSEPPGLQLKKHNVINTGEPPMSYHCVLFLPTASHFPWAPEFSVCPSHLFFMFCIHREIYSVFYICVCVCVYIYIYI